jgi:hypothetical protein
LSHALVLLPYAASVGISLVVGGIAVRRRAVPGALLFAALVFSHAGWTAGQILELCSRDLAAKLFWDDLQWPFTFGVATATFGFALVFTGRRLPAARFLWGAIVLVAVAFLALVATSGSHGLVRSDARLAAWEPFDALVYEFGPATLEVR